MNSVTRRLFPFLWSYELQALVRRRRQETTDVVSFELLPNTHWHTPQAGQFVELSYPVDGESLERAYSISSSNGHSFWITVKRQPQGKVSNALHDHLQVGDCLQLRGPFGEFVYKGQPSLLLLAAGSGITPCFALVHALLALPEAQRPAIQLFAQFTRPEDTIFAQTLQQWQNQQSPRFQVQVAYSQAPQAGTCPPLSTSLQPTSQLALQPGQFAERFPHFHSQHIYLCGPQGFQQSIRDCLQAADYPLEQLQLEHFQPQTLNQQQLALADASELLPEVYFATHNCRIQLGPQDRHKSLLQLGLEQGLNLEKGCQKGYCGSCKLVLQQGEVRGQTHGQAVYICSAYASSERVVLGY